MFSLLRITGKAVILAFEPLHDKTNIMTCASSEDSDRPGHPPSLIRVFAVRLKKPKVLSYPLSAQRRLWMPRLIWVFAGRTCHFVGFGMWRLNFRLCPLDLDTDLGACCPFLFSVLGGMWDSIVSASRRCLLLHKTNEFQRLSIFPSTCIFRAALSKIIFWWNVCYSSFVYSKVLSLPGTHHLHMPKLHAW